MRRQSEPGRWNEFHPTGPTTRRIWHGRSALWWRLGTQSTRRLARRLGTARRILYQSVQLEAERDRGDIDAVIETEMTIGMLLRELAITVKHGRGCLSRRTGGGAFDREHLSHERGEGQDLKIASQGERGLEATPDVFS